MSGGADETHLECEEAEEAALEQSPLDVLVASARKAAAAARASGRKEVHWQVQAKHLC